MPDPGKILALDILPLAVNEGVPIAFPIPYDEVIARCIKSSGWTIAAFGLWTTVMMGSTFV